MKVILEVVENATSSFYEVQKTSITVGRDPKKSDITLVDDGASKKHFELHFSNQRWWVVDLNSKNGTYVNQDSIERQEFYLDDVIQVGEAYIRFSSAHMSLTVNQLLRRPGKKYSFNQSITFVQLKDKSGKPVFNEEKTEMKEVTMITQNGNILKDLQEDLKKKA